MECREDPAQLLGPHHSRKQNHATRLKPLLSICPCSWPYKISNHSEEHDLPVFASEQTRFI